MLLDNLKSGIDEWCDIADLKSIQALGNFASRYHDSALDIMNSLGKIAEKSSDAAVIDMAAYQIYIVAYHAGKSDVALKKHALDMLGNIHSEFAMMKVRDLCYSDFDLVQQGLKVCAKVPMQQAVQNISRFAQDIPGMGIRGISTLADMKKHFARTSPNIVTLAEGAITEIKKSISLACSPV